MSDKTPEQQAIAALAEAEKQAKLIEDKVGSK